MPQKILFLVPYPLRESPSQRFRFEQYFELLRKNGFHLNIQSFLNSHNWQIFFRPGMPLDKTRALVVGFINRLVALFKAPFYDFIFIHREAAPLGPPLVEWILAKILRKRIIYDFDDAIWLTDRDQEASLMKILKWRSKVKSICRWSYRISCGNEYLGAYAKMFNDQVVYNPTTVDTQHLHNPDLYKIPPTGNNQVVIGWTGSHSTLKYLLAIESVLQKIETEFPVVQVMIIADRKSNLKLNSLCFVPWNRETEIEDLMRLDIGIMPLPDDEWAKGKCGFKALQYMALRIPVVASRVGVNLKIIDHGVDGILCTSEKEWQTALTKLIQDTVLRKKMGYDGRKKIIENYSTVSNASNFLSLFA